MRDRLRGLLDSGPDEHVVVREKPDREIVERTEEPMSPVEVDSRVSSGDWIDGRYRVQEIVEGRYGDVLWSEEFGNPEVERERQQEIAELRQENRSQREAIREQRELLEDIAQALQGGGGGGSNLDEPSISYEISGPADLATHKALTDDEWLDNRLDSLGERMSRMLGSGLSQAAAGGSRASKSESATEDSSRPGIGNLDAGPTSFGGLEESAGDADTDDDDDGATEGDSDGEEKADPGSSAAGANGNRPDSRIEEIAEDLDGNDDLVADGGRALPTDGLAVTVDRGSGVVSDLTRPLRRLDPAELTDIAAATPAPPTRPERQVVNTIRRDSRIRFPAGGQDRGEFVRRLARQVLDRRRARRIQAEQPEPADTSQSVGQREALVGLGAVLLLLLLGGG